MQTTKMESFEINACISLANPANGKGVRIANRDGTITFDSAKQMFTIAIQDMISFRLTKDELCLLPRANCPNGNSYIFSFNKFGMPDLNEVCLRRISESDKRKLHNCLLELVGVRLNAMRKVTSRPLSSISVADSRSSESASIDSIGNDERRQDLNNSEIAKQCFTPTNWDDVDANIPAQSNSTQSSAERNSSSLGPNKRPRLDDSVILPLEISGTFHSTHSSSSSGFESENISELRLQLECAQLKLTIGMLRTELREAKMANERQSDEKQMEWENLRKEDKKRIAKLEENLQTKEREMGEKQKELEKTKGELKEAREGMQKERIAHAEQMRKAEEELQQRMREMHQWEMRKHLTKESIDKLLVMAVHQPKADKLVRELLQSGASANVAGKTSGKTILHLAAKKGNAGVVGQLLDHGALVDSPAGANGAQGIGGGGTALHIALENNQMGVVKLLVARGANLEVECDGRRPIHYAAQFCSTEIVQLLLDKGARVNVKGQNGQSALHLAMEGQNFDMVQLLIGRGADLKAEDAQGDRPIHYSVKATNKSNEMVELVLAKSHRWESINMKGQGGKTPLHLALEKAGRFPIAKMLLEKGADVEAQDNEGNRPLWYAISMGKSNFVHILLDHKVSIDAKNGPNGQTALHVAAARGIFGIVEMLVKKGASLESEDNHGERPLHMAVKSGHLAVVQLLLKSGSKIDSVDNDGCSALHYSLIFDRQSSLKIARLLLDHAMENGGKREVLALVNQKDKEGKTAMDLAKQNRRMMVVKLFEGKGARGNNE